MASSCCCGDNESAGQQATRLGYTREELQALPDGANLGLGCGNPLAFLEVKPGDTVLDLGSGAGIDCFLAAQKVGPRGLVIGVDMTTKMIDKANQNRGKIGAANVEFRAGQIENLPVETGSVDLVISNCVINLSPDKTKVFREAFRVLKSGGLLQISDIVLLKKLPRPIRKSVNSYVGCVAGAAKKEDYLSYIRDAGFIEMEILEERGVGDIFLENDPTIQKPMRWVPFPRNMMRRMSGSYAESIKVRAVKPAAV